MQPESSAGAAADRTPRTKARGHPRRAVDAPARDWTPPPPGLRLVLLPERGAFAMLSCQKKLFSLPDGHHYLNCAYISPLSRPVEEAALAGLARERWPTQVRPADFFTDAAEIRRRFARLIGADAPERVALVPSVSYGIASVGHNAEISRSQTIVVAADQFPSNVYIWERRAVETGAQVRTVAAPESEARSRAWTAALIDAIDETTAVVALGQVHWTDGTLFDLEAIGERAREVGAALVIDGSQSVGAYPFDMQTIQPDALVCCGYKWLLGLYGMSLAYIGERFAEGHPIEETWLGRRGSDDFRRLVDYDEEYRSGAARYDAGGSANFTHVPALKTALGMLLEWKPEAVQSYCRALTQPLVDEARAREWRVEDETGRGAHILGIRLPPETDFGKLERAIEEMSVTVSMRGDCVRVSPHVYNDEEDIQTLIAALRASL